MTGQRRPFLALQLNAQGAAERVEQLHGPDGLVNELVHVGLAGARIVVSQPHRGQHQDGHRTSGGLPPEFAHHFVRGKRQCLRTAPSEQDLFAAGERHAKET